MNIADNYQNQLIWDRLSDLKRTADKKRKSDLQKRLSGKPQAAKLEYLLGAFLEMYEPHLIEFVERFAKKGYALDPSSGFGGKNSELQVITGDFSINYVLHNKLERLGVKFREFNGSKSFVFWPDDATLEHINARWMKIISILPDNGYLKNPSASPHALAFRRKFIPKDLDSRKQRLFDKLKFSTQRKVENDLRKRITGNPHPNKIELMLGLFREELEPQVRQAVLNMNKKGYSTDVSGFMDSPNGQMIEGDFLLDENTVKILESSGATVETNPSGYTRLQFFAEEPDISMIRKRWNKIISRLPVKSGQVSISMTRKARDFRLRYE